MKQVLPGQVWSVLLGSRDGRADIRIERVDDESARHRLAHGRLVSSGRAISLRFSCLARGLRGARLVIEANGQSIQFTSKPRPGLDPTKEERRTASDCRKEKRPRGVVAALRPCEIEAHEMFVSDELSYSTIAERYGVSISTVRGWVDKVTASRSEERIRSLT